jgi:predicted cupin superfamily sugar epimerase
MPGRDLTYINVTRMTADDVISCLALLPHPEGGFYREIFRDTHEIAGRSASTAIYYLLCAGQKSRWHRVDAAEVWHWYSGAPLLLRTWPERGSIRTSRLGPDLHSGERPAEIVPRGVWQSAEAAGVWVLAGCTVAPGFQFAGFELAAADWEPPDDPC